MQRSKRFLANFLRAKCWSVVVGLSFLVIDSATLNAQTAPSKIWTDSTRDNNWFTGVTGGFASSNWANPAGTPAPIPTSADTVAVNNGTTAQIGAPNAVAASLFIGDPLPGSPALFPSTVQLLVGGSLSVANPVIIGKDGTLRFSGGGNSGGTVSAPSFQNGGNIVFDGPLAHVLNTTVTGSGNFIMAGSGTLAVNAKMGDSPNVEVNSGVLTINFNGAITNGAISVNGGTAQIAAAGEAVNTLSIGSTAAGSTLQMLLGGSLSVANPVIIGTGGTLRFSGSSTSGTLSAPSIQNGGNIVFDGPLVHVMGIPVTGSGNYIMAGTGTLAVNAKMGDSPNVEVNSGVLTVNFNGAITNGTISVNGGTAQIAAAGEAVNTLSIGTTAAGSTLQMLPGGGLSVANPVTIGTGGTLRFSGGGGSGGTLFANAIQDNGNILFDGPLDHALNAVVTGTGALTMAGTGTLSLSGNSTYSGGTTISAGTLQAGSATGFSPNSEFTVNSILDLHGFNNTIGSLSGTGTVLNNGATAAALTVGTDNASTSFNGVLENGTSALQLTKSGTGTLTLTGNNTYTGGTTISAGALQLGNGGTTGSITGNVIDNSALIFNRSDSITFGGVISGLGSVTQIGTGTTILTGNNTYTGDTTISAGTLQLGNGGTTGSIAGNVIDNGTLAFNRSDSVTFGGVISGIGNVVKLGTGTLTLPTANTYTGSTTVNAGSLIVNGSIASAQTVVNPGGFLGGNGTIGGSLVNSGIVGQVNSPGTLTVTSNYTQNSDGTLRIGVAGLASGQHDLLAVNGHATVAGTLQLIQLGNFTLQPGNQVTFLTAKNGVSGTFNSAQNGLVSTGTIVQAEVTTLPNAVVLEAVQGSFANTAGVTATPNDAAVAKALDSAAGDPRAAALFAFLNSQPLANLPHDLALIAPTQISSINATAVSVGKVQVSNLGQRLGSIRGGSTGFSSSGFAISGATSFGAGFAGVSGPEGKSGTSVLAPIPENRWGVFLTGLGEFTNVDSTPNAAGYDVDTGGFTLGVDYRLTPNFAIGLTGGYAHNSVNIDGGGGNIGVNAGEIGLYATVFGNGFYLDTAVSGGPSSYNTKRTALQGTARGNTDGGDVNVLVAAGYDWKSGNLTIGPTASFQYSYVGLNGFTESGSLAPLTFPDQNTESERTAFGAKVSYNWKIGQITAIPQISAAWQHEYGATAYSVIAGFASGAGSSFTVVGPQIGRDSLLIGAGATVILSDRVSTYLYYDGEVARTNYESHSVTGGVRITF